MNTYRSSQTESKEMLMLHPQQWKKLKYTVKTGAGNIHTTWSILITGNKKYFANL
jgi:hypothetical protein